MKKKSYLALALIGLVLIGLTSCKKSSNNSNNPSGQSMSASISGNNNFSANSFYGVHSISGGVLDLVGYKVANGDTTALSLTVWDTVSVGVTDSLCLWGWAEYGAFTTASAEGIGLPWQENNAGGEGVFSVSAWDTTTHMISGTFSGTLYQVTSGINDYDQEDSLKMSNGKFTMTYTNVP
jgi:hypothetical protein